MKKTNPMLLFLSIMIFCSSSIALGKSLSEEEKLDLFSQAKTFFREANEVSSTDSKKAHDLYMKAAMRYERIAREGSVKNGKLYYNIGNAYFLMGNIGQAILNYRRAQRYIPNDSNLFQNRDYALSKRVDKVDEKPETRVLKTVLFWHYDFSTQTRSLIFILLFIAFWVSLSIRLFFHQAMPRWLIIGLVLLMLSLFASLLVESVIEANDQTGVVLAEEVIARKGDGKSYQQSFKEPLHSGTEFKLLEERHDWFNIELLDGRQCWIPKNTAELVW